MPGNRTPRATAAIAVCAILIISLAPAASADFGPKPSLDITVKNPPEGEYILDLLVDYDSEYENLYGSERNKIDRDMLAILENYSVDGWYPALAHGTRVPLFGSLTGTKQSNGTMRHSFSYIGTPDTYKIIIVTRDMQVYVSDVMERRVFADTVTVDFAEADHETGTITAASISGSAGGIIAVYAKQLALTLPATLVVEGLLLFAFGLSLKRNWIVFLIVNVVTQLALTAATGSALIFGGTMSAMFAYIVMEIVILIAEWTAYGRLLSGRTRARYKGYAFVANTASAAAGWLFMLWSGSWTW